MNTSKLQLHILTKLDFRRILTDIRLIELSMILAKKFPKMSTQNMMERIRDPAC